jgi:5-methylcytosine-specific restriction endonuclease McrA
MTSKGYKQTPDHIASRIRVGKDHYAWLGDNVSVKGGRTRANRMYPIIGPCVICGSARSERHHKDGNTANNTPENIVPLCRKCHMSKDGRLELLSLLGSKNQKSGVARIAAAKKRSEQTHCKRGHQLSGDNLFITSLGARGCRECRKIHKHAYISKNN